MNINSTNEKAKDKLYTILFFLGLSESNDSYDPPGDRKEFLILHQFHHEIDAISTSVSVDIDKRIITWSEDFILLRDKASIRKTITETIASNKLEKLVSDELFQIMIKADEPNIYNSYKSNSIYNDIISYYDNNKYKFQDIEDVICGKSVNAFDKNQAHLMKCCFILTSLFMEEMKKYEINYDINKNEKSVYILNFMSQVELGYFIFSMRLIIGVYNIAEYFLTKNDFFKNALTRGSDFQKSYSDMS